MKRVAIALLGLLLAVPVHAASEVKEGQEWLSGPSGPPVMLYDGTYGRAWRGDAYGIGRVTEEYPDVLQYDSQSIVGTAMPMVAGAYKLMGAWEWSPFGKQAMEVVFSDTDTDAVRFFLESSDDNTNWNVVLKNQWGTTTSADTLKLTVVGGLSRVTIPMSDVPYPGRYVRMFVARDSTAASSRSISSAKIMRRYN